MHSAFVSRGAPTIGYGEDRAIAVAFFAGGMPNVLRSARAWPWQTRTHRAYAARLRLWHVAKPRLDVDDDNLREALGCGLDAADLVLGMSLLARVPCSGRQISNLLARRRITGARPRGLAQAQAPRAPPRPLGIPASVERQIAAHHGAAPPAIKRLPFAPAPPPPLVFPASARRLPLERARGTEAASVGFTAIGPG